MHFTIGFASNLVRVNFLKSEELKTLNAFPTKVSTEITPEIGLQAIACHSLFIHDSIVRHAENHAIIMERYT